jgi:hypothetical protein
MIKWCSLYSVGMPVCVHFCSVSAVVRCVGSLLFSSCALISLSALGVTLCRNKCSKRCIEAYCETFCASTSRPHDAYDGTHELQTHPHNSLGIRLHEGTIQYLSKSNIAGKSMSPHIGSRESLTDGSEACIHEAFTSELIIA